MLDNTSKWSHPRGNTVVPSRWQATHTYVLVVPDAGQTTQPSRLDVVVDGQSDGYAILRGSSLTVGTLVVLRT